MSILFRVENQVSWQGLWYDANGNFKPFIFDLEEGKARDMPMDPDPSYGLGGKRWYSACESIPALSMVFSFKDIVELEGLGYSLYLFEVREYRTNEWHALFAREDVHRQEKLDLAGFKSYLRNLNG